MRWSDLGCFGDGRAAERALVRRPRPRRVHPPHVALRRRAAARGARGPAGRRHRELLVGARHLQPAPARAGGGGAARRDRGGRRAARVPDDLARREPDEADRDAVPEPDVDGRRGVHPRVPARRRRPDRRLRQDRAGAADGRALGRRAGDRAHRRPGRARVLPRPRARRGHRPLAPRRGGARRPDDAGRVRRVRGRERARRRALQRARHRLDDRGAGRGARHVAAGDGRDPGRRSRGRVAPPRRPARVRSSSPAKGCGRGRSSPPRRSTTRSRC